tara:strand:- start:600 stop:1184 length:585 start_codon:yes stop_codon:yes gene_type:complete
VPICVVVLTKAASGRQLLENFQQKSIQLSNYSFVKPYLDPNKSNPSLDIDFTEEEEGTLQGLKAVEVKDVKLLNPKLSRKSRQRNLALWLMPFGFFAGLSFTQMTNLTTFQNLGAPTWSEALIGGLLGLGSGLIGSFTAAASINEEKDKEIKKLLKKNQEGKWLLILETPFGIELPWESIQEVNPIEIIGIDES